VNTLNPRVPLVRILLVEDTPDIAVWLVSALPKFEDALLNQVISNGWASTGMVVSA